MFPISRHFVSQISSCLVLSLAGTLGGAALSAGPSADGQTATRTAIVSAQALDLTSPQGQAALNRRVDIAARRVCDSFNVFDLHDAADYRQCLEQARRAAQVQVGTLVAQASQNQLQVATTAPRPK